MNWFTAPWINKRIYFVLNEKIYILDFIFELKEASYFIWYVRKRKLGNDWISFRYLSIHLVRVRALKIFQNKVILLFMGKFEVLDVGGNKFIFYS